MRLQVGRKTEINSSPADVFRFIAVDHERNHPRWDKYALELRQIDPGPVQVGTRFAYKRRRLGQFHDLQITVSEMVPPKNFTFQVTGTPWTGTISYTVDARAELASTLEYFASVETAGPQWLGPLFMPIVKREISVSQRRIKELVESETR